jgi:hypothetical protein
MKLTFDDLLGWEFEVDEVSVGVYRVTGRSRFGRQVDLTGVDPEALLDDCKAVARKSCDQQNSG